MFHAIRADLLVRLGLVDEATHAYETAMALTLNTPERDLLRRRNQALTEA